MSEASGVLPSCEQIVDMLPEPFVVIDRHYRIMAANQAYRRHYEVAREAVVGRHCYEVSHHSQVPCSRNGEHCPLDDVFRNGRTTQVMHMHYDQSGRTQPVQLQAVPIFGSEGGVRYVGEFIHPVGQLAEDHREPLLVGRSRPMLSLLSVLHRVARTQTTVLLLGESGVGKEQVARYVHHYSRSGDAPFVVVDCAALGDQVIESELFGHEKGAFTGAVARKRGLFEVAHGGTLFIDEIGELSLALQSKLLRVLETGNIRRVGGTGYIETNVRVIAATHRDLARMVEHGEFRSDLYYRLSAFPVRVPSLREHADDIPALAEHFLNRMDGSDRHLPLQPEVIERLLSYDYPGNARELRNIIERASIMAGNDIIRPEHVEFHVNAQGTEEPQAVTPTPVLCRRTRRLSDAEVLAALKGSSGHRGQAAARLGVSERTVYRYIRQLKGSGVTVPEMENGGDV